MLKQKPLTSSILVLFQVIFIAFLVFTGKIFVSNIIFIILMFTAVFPSLWAVFHMRDKIRFTPAPSKGAKLITAGPYKYIRHPMYATVISVALLWIFIDFSFLRLVVYLFIIINMIVKIYYEENILINSFEGYREYMTMSKRIIPFIF
ncbi:MAG: isoprenylcysteine carboxylmethyltransferase family protein [Ignavibacteria bacterium]|nr:isoprenylcysteine carboxylmethyltransferase family protein [Ignavibacteria bacterium]